MTKTNVPTPNANGEIICVVYVDYAQPMAVALKSLPKEVNLQTDFEGYQGMKAGDDITVGIPTGGEAGEKEVVLFEIKDFLTAAQMDSEYARRGLNPAHSLDLIAANALHPTLADAYSNCTHWQRNGKGHYCYLGFKADKARLCLVDFGRYSGWYAGNRKSASTVL